MADFILQNPHQAALMTLHDIAEATGVSKATANRLAARLGLPGYPELKRLLKAELQEALSPVEDLGRALRVRNLSDAAPWTQSINEDLERIRTIEAVGGDEAFSQASDLLARKGRVFIAGFGSSSFVAQYAAFCLSSLRKDCEAIPDRSGLEGVVRKLVDAGPEDVALIIAFARYTDHVVRVARQLHAQKVPIIGVTDDRASPLFPLATSCFLVKRKRGFVVTSSGSGAMVVVEALLRGTATALGPKEMEQRAARITSLLGESLVLPQQEE